MNIDGVRRPQRGFWRAMDVSLDLIVRVVVGVIVLLGVGVACALAALIAFVVWSSVS